MADTKISALTAATTPLAGTETIPLVQGGVTVSTPIGNALKINAGTTAVSNPVADLSQTWNNGAVTFTGLKFNVTNTASDIASRIFDFQVGGVSRMYLLRDSGPVVTNPAGAFSVAESTGGNIKVQTYWESGPNKQLALASDVLLGWTDAASISGATDTRLYRDAANTLAQRNGTNAQTSRVYNTYTDASNYERGFARWNSNVYEIGTEAAGSGSARNMRFVLPNGGYLDCSALDANNWNFANGMRIGLASPFGVVIAAAANQANQGLHITKDGLLFGRDGTTNVFITAEGKTGDAATGSLTITGRNARTTATTNITGGQVAIVAGAGASASAGAAHGGHVYLDGGQGYGTGEHGDVIVGNTRGVARLPVKTVATLPSAATAGRRCFVSDANATTYHSVVAGGGANFVPVFSDGTNWRIG